MEMIKPQTFQLIYSFLIEPASELPYRGGGGNFKNNLVNYYFLTVHSKKLHFYFISYMIYFRLYTRNTREIQSNGDSSINTALLSKNAVFKSLSHEQGLLLTEHHLLKNIN